MKKKKKKKKNVNSNNNKNDNNNNNKIITITTTTGIKITIQITTNYRPCHWLETVMNLQGQKTSTTSTGQQKRHTWNTRSRQVTPSIQHHTNSFRV